MSTVEIVHEICMIINLYTMSTRCMIERMGILHVLWLSCTLIINSTMHRHLMDSRICKRDVMTQRLRHRRWWHMAKWLRDRRRRNNRRRQRRMIGTPLTVYLMVLNCMAW
jgi:hypothetical protein